jgi:hypothetical protein
LEFKGKLAHMPKMFEPDPLPYHLFVYAYEDVLFLDALYKAQSKALKARNIENIHQNFCLLRSPPRALPREHPAFGPACKIAIAVTDSQFVVCLASKTESYNNLPSDLIEAPSPSQTHTYLKKQASTIWARVMGKAPKYVAAAVNAKLRSPIRFAAECGDYLVYEAVVDDCIVVLGSLDAIFKSVSTASRFDIVLQRKSSLVTLPTGPEGIPASVFQFFSDAVSIEVEPIPDTALSYELPIDDKMNTGDQATDSPSFRVSLELTTLGTKVTASLRVGINPAAEGGQQAVAAAISSGSNEDENPFFFNFPASPCEINLDPTRTSGPSLFAPSGSNEDTTTEPAADAFIVTRTATVRRVSSCSTASSMYLSFRP